MYFYFNHVLTRLLLCLSIVYTYFHDVFFLAALWSAYLNTSVAVLLYRHMWEILRNKTCQWKAVGFCYHILIKGEKSRLKKCNNWLKEKYAVMIKKTDIHQCRFSDRASEHIHCGSCTRSCPQSWCKKSHSHRSQSYTRQYLSDRKTQASGMKAGQMFSYSTIKKQGVCASKQSHIPNIPTQSSLSSVDLYPVLQEHW